jgi:hypothetical protein
MVFSNVGIGALLLVGAQISGQTLNAQTTSTNVVAAVPGQVLTAKRVFISNAGSESYGSESYFRLTKYDGGPDRFYNQLYAAMKTWGRFELTESPTSADVVYEARFTNPIVDKKSRNDGVYSPQDNRNDFIYDPQLNLTIIDPQTRVTLWSLTEHIQPGSNRESDNRNFDAAVDRMMARTKMLVESVAMPSANQSMISMAPVGAIDAERLHERQTHAAAGIAVGTLGGALLSSREFHVCPAGSGMNCGRSRALTSLGYVVSGALSGALIGWLWPTH